MARVWQTGFEWQSVTDGMEQRTNMASPTISTTTKHSGSASLRCSNSSLAAGAYRGFDYLFAAQTVVYARWYFYIDSQDDNANVLTTMDLFLGTTNALSVQIVRSGSTYTADTIINNYATSLGTFAVGIDAWHYIEVYYDTTAADGSEKVTVRYDGAAQITRTNLTLTSKTITVIQAGYYNGTAGAITGTDVYFDDAAINNGTGSVNNSFPGEGNIAIMVPVGAGDNAATAGTYASIDEVPPTTADYIELDSNSNIGDYTVTAPATAGISGTIKAVSVLCRIREEAAGTSSYQIRIKSASGGTVTSTTAGDAGNATPRTNPASTTAFLRPLISETDPTTSTAWTVTGTNSLTNMQIGVTNVDSDSTPDIWIHALAAMVEYLPPSGSVETATISAQSFNITASSLTANYESVLNSSVSVLNTTTSSSGLTANYLSLLNSAVQTLNLSLLSTDLTPSYVSVQSVSVSSTSLLCSANSLTATYESIFDSSEQVLDFYLTCNLLTANYVYECDAVVEPQPIDSVLSNITANYIETYDSIVDKIDTQIISNSLTATFEETRSAILSTVEINLTQPTINGTYLQVSSAEVVSLVISLLTQTLSATRNEVVNANVNHESINITVSQLNAFRAVQSSVGIAIMIDDEIGFLI